MSQELQRPRRTTVAAILLSILFIVLALRQVGSAQGTAASTPKYRAEILEAATGGKARAAALESVLNNYADQGYEIFDIDRDASGNTLVVFQRVAK